MPRKRSKCIEENCDKITYGIHCKEHSYKLRKKFNSTREMQRNHSLMKKYGLSLEEFDALWIVFKGRCGICDIQMKLPENRQGQSLDVVAVDHDHKTGNIRGLLCNACNKGLGLFRDSIYNLEKAKEWLNYGKKISDNS